MNQYNCQQTMMYEQLTLNTYLNGNNQPIQLELNTPHILDYFNNQFTDELGITGHRDVEINVDDSNLIMMAPITDSFNNVTNNLNNNRQSAHQSSVVDINNNNQNGHYDNEIDDNDDSNVSQHEISYAQVNEENGRAKSFKPLPIVSD